MLAKQTNYIVGIYLRLSKDDERAGESLSIENQRRILNNYVHEQGWEIYDEYIDDGISGTSFNRPGVQRMLEDAKNGKINLIICKDLSLFGRNYIQVGQYTDYIFPMYNIRFIALYDGIDTLNSDSANMDMMPIRNVFNEWHAANTSKKVRAVIAANAKAGKFMSPYCPYGYVKGDDEMLKHSEAEQQDEADVAEFIKRLKHYAGATELTREMCLELTEYVTVDENNKGNKDRPRVIHIYYKLIDKPLTNKNNALTL